MEDIRLGRKSRSSYRTVPVGVTPTLVAPANPNRRTLVIGAPTNDNYVAGTNSDITATSGYGFGGFGVSPITLSIEVNGDIVTREWYVLCNAARSVAVIETFLDEK